MNKYNVENAFRTFGNKYISLKNQILVKELCRWIPVHLVTEYPKSGGTWLSQLLSGYLNIPFIRNAVPKFTESVLHGHYLPGRTSSKLKNILFLVRDGRDVMISYYYQSLLLNDKNKYNPKNIKYCRDKLQFKDYEDICSNLPAFIEFIFTDIPPRYVKFVHEGNWTSFNNRWLEYSEQNKGNLILTRYEALLEDTTRELIRLLNNMNCPGIDMARLGDIVNEMSFQNQSKRKPGEENIKSFLRKGIAGDWKNKFTRESADVFDYYGGDMLVKLGYEKNSSWKDQFKK